MDGELVVSFAAVVLDVVVFVVVVVVVVAVVVVAAAAVVVVVAAVDLVVFAVVGEAAFVVDFEVVVSVLWEYKMKFQMLIGQSCPRVTFLGPDQAR